MELPSGEDDLVVLSRLEKTKIKILASSNHKNKTRARRVYPADEGAAKLSPLLPGVFRDVSGPV